MQAIKHTRNMSIRFQPLSRRRSGYVLMMIMAFLAVSLTIFAGIMYWVSTNAKITLRNNAFTGAEAAAESATETALANMIRDFSFGSLNPVNSYTGLLPSQAGWPVQYQFSNIGIAVGNTSWSALNSQFAGLFGLVQICTNIATATAINGPVGVPATVQQVVQFTSIPIFQYAVFYNMDLEIEPGNVMNINGHVHSNNNIWTTGNSSSLPLTYQNLVDASGGIFLQGSTNSSQSGAAPANSVVFSISQNNPLPNVDSLTMPIGTNNNPAAVGAIIKLPPANLAAPSAAAYSPIGSVYLYNGADLIITNNAGNPANFTVLYDNQNTTVQLTPVLPDVVVVTTNSSAHTTQTNAYYSFVTNATFYDYREGDTVQAIQVDVGKLNAWLTNNAAVVSVSSSTTVTIGGTNRGGYQYNALNSSGSTSKNHGINSVYIYNSVPMNAATLPAVRLVNGAQLPSAGLTVATAQPIYVEGNYNITTNGSNFANSLGSTTNGATVPAALIGDAVTILSSSWSDNYNSGTALASRTPVSTCVNAACLEGIVPSANGANYSGGVENFFRLLENWNSSTVLTYNGSIVCMFPSQYATNIWQKTGIYYNPPNRQWGFDVNFLKGQQYLPPLTPQAKYVIRSSWAAW
jgi:hypothetical protein